MDANKIEKLLELIEECVNEQGKTWNEKADPIKAAANEACMAMALEEFASWFEVEDEE